MDTARPIDGAIWAALVELLGTRLPEVCETYIHETQERLIQMHVAIEAGDANAMFDAAHSMRSIALTVGALGLAERAEALIRSGPAQEPDYFHTLLQRMVDEFVAVRHYIRAEIDNAAQAG